MYLNLKISEDSDTYMNKITKIEVQKKNKTRVNIYVDEEYSFSCDAELVYTHKLKINEVVDMQLMQEVVSEDNLKKAKRDALRIIEKSYKTEKEIYNKLLTKGYEENVIMKVIDFMGSYNFVDDEKYAQAYIKDKIITQGRDKIFYALSAKGVDVETIKDNLASVNEDVEFAGAKKIGIKKYEALIKRESDSRKIEGKLKQYLASKGYSWDMIKRVSIAILKNEEGDAFEA
jgi:regulatory protein